MPQQLTGFVAPIAEPLSLMPSHFTQLSLSIQSTNASLQSQVASLIASTGNSSFQGLGADAFAKAIDYYLGIANQHSSMLEQTSSVIQTCSTQLLNTVDAANASNPDSIIVNTVLGRVTLDQVVEQGSSPVETVLQEIRQTLHDMANQAQSYGNEMAKAGQSFGEAFSDFFHGNFGGAGHDFQQSWGDFTQSWGDLGQFMLDTGKLLWESVFEMTAAALIQCAEDIWQAIKKCFSTLSSLIAKAVQEFNKGEQQLMQFSEQEMEQIIKKNAPWVLEWFKDLPSWAKILVVLLVATGLALLAWMTFGGRSAPLPPEKQALANDLYNEFGGDISLNEIEQMIRDHATWSKEKLRQELLLQQLREGKGYVSQLVGKTVKLSEGKTKVLTPADLEEMIKAGYTNTHFAVLLGLRPLSDATTPGGRPLTWHALSDSILRHRITLQEIDSVIDNPSRTSPISDGGTAYIKSTKQGYYLVIVNASGQIVTAIKNLTAAELRNLGRRYGFNPNP